MQLYIPIKVRIVHVDPQPLCRVNASATLADNDYLWIQCSLRYSGKTNLSMNWIRSSTGSVVQSISNLRNQSMIIIRVNSTDNGETFIFKATFTQESNSFETVITWNYTANVLSE